MTEMTFKQKHGGIYFVVIVIIGFGHAWNKSRAAIACKSGARIDGMAQPAPRGMTHDSARSRRDKSANLHNAGAIGVDVIHNLIEHGLLFIRK